MKALLDVPESLLELLSGDAADVPLKGGDGEGVPADVVEVIGRKGGLVVEVPHSRDRHVPDGIVVRPGFLEGAVDPFVKVTPVVAVEGEVIIVQEIGAPAASGSGQGGFRDHSVAFQQHWRGEQGRYGARPHFAGEEVHPAERSPVGQLHLGHVPGSVGFRVGIQVHHFGRPGDRSVGIGVMGMKDDGEFSPLEACGGHAGADADEGLPFFQVQDVAAGQGVQALRIENPVVGGIGGGPGTEGIGPALVELGRGNGAPGKGSKEGKNPSHTRYKTNIFCLILPNLSNETENENA